MRYPPRVAVALIDPESACRKETKQLFVERFDNLCTKQLPNSFCEEERESTW
jgi:hypothetical protein